MLRKTSDMIGFGLEATDGEIGRVDDFYFDDDTWQIRYMVAKTGPWLFGREVLIAASVLEEPRWNAGLLPVRLTKEQIKESPDIDLAQPISRQRELTMYEHYRWPVYWAPMPAATGTAVGGMGMVPPAGVAPLPTETATTPSTRDAEIRRMAEQQMEEGTTQNLRSINEVTGYNIHATDDNVGHVDDFFVDEDDWTIRYMLVDTSNWLPGRKVLIAPSWIERFSWDEREVYVEMTRQDIENSPEYDPRARLTREYETELHNYYEYPMYWGV